MKQTVEEKLDELEEIINRIYYKVESKVRGKKNSHIHIMVNTEEKKKLMKKADEDGIDFSEWCRKKLRGDAQLDRIESKLKLIAEKNG